MKHANKINKLIDRLSDITEQLTIIRDDLQDTYDSKSDRWQETDAGELMLDQIGKLDDLITNLEYTDDSRPED